MKNKLSFLLKSQSKNQSQRNGKLNFPSLTHQKEFGLKYPYSPSLKGGYSSVVNNNT